MSVFKTKSQLPRPLAAAAEAARQACLQELGILQSGKDEAIDNLVESVANFFRVPMALVTLIDADRQWYKSTYGIDGEGTPRAESFCQYTIRQTGMFRVQNAGSHPELKSYPAVTGHPFVRFYAGVPIRVRTGHAIGSLCILDQKPNAVPVNKLHWLNHFASILTQIIELNYAANDEQIIRQFAKTDTSGMVSS